jgi:ABC-type spermidine/putrescine transport system permease subunit II
MDSLRVSVVLALTTVVVATTLGTGISLALTRHAFRGRAALNFLILSPIAVPRVASGVALFLLFIAIGVRTAPLRLLVVHVLLACPFVVAVVTASLHGLDPRVDEALGPWRRSAVTCADQRHCWGRCSPSLRHLTK